MSVVVGDAEIQEQLMLTNEEYRRLANEHKAFSEELDQLQSRHFLTEEERVREVTLKKKKLFLKDQMYTMLQKRRSAMKAGA